MTNNASPINNVQDAPSSEQDSTGNETATQTAGKAGAEPMYDKEAVVRFFLASYRHMKELQTRLGHVSDEEEDEDGDEEEDEENRDNEYDEEDNEAEQVKKARVPDHVTGNADKTKKANLKSR
jgi:hypothetical protein